MFNCVMCRAAKVKGFWGEMQGGLTAAHRLPSYRRAAVGGELHKTTNEYQGAPSESIYCIEGMKRNFQ